LPEYCASVASYFALYFVVVVERKNKIHVIEEWTWEMVFVLEFRVEWIPKSNYIFEEHRLFNGKKKNEKKYSTTKSCEFPKLFRCLQETFKSFKVCMNILVLLFYKYTLTIAKYQLTNSTHYDIYVKSSERTKSFSMKT
jgi:hypothetical protein